MLPGRDGNALGLAGLETGVTSEMGMSDLENGVTKIAVALEVGDG